MEYDLPEFEKRPQYQVLPYVKEVFTKNFARLIEYDDGHYRVIFKSSYFVLPEGAEEPSKSQWGTLKKKMKRHHKGVFIFKETGKADCEGGQGDCYYLDFGFFAYA
jgi:hypothetical protein